MEKGTEENPPEKLYIFWMINIKMYVRETGNALVICLFHSDVRVHWKISLFHVVSPSLDEDFTGP